MLQKKASKPKIAKPAKPKKKEPTKRQLEAKAKQKGLEREFKKQQRRLNAMVKRGQEKGYTFSPKVLESINKPIKRVTKSSINRLVKMDAKTVYKKASKSFEIDGKLVTLIGEKARKQDRSISARRAVETRKRKANVKAMLDELSNGNISIPFVDNSKFTGIKTNIPLVEDWEPERIEQYKRKELLHGKNDDWYNRGVEKTGVASARSVAEKAWNDIFLVNNGYVDTASPTLSNVIKRFFGDISNYGYEDSYAEYQRLGLKDLTFDQFLSSSAQEHRETLQAYAQDLLNHDLITLAEYRDIMEEIEENYHEEVDGLRVRYGTPSAKPQSAQLKGLNRNGRRMAQRKGWV